jgi:hypothetical protein
MAKKLRTITGFYSPSFLHIHVNTDKTLKDFGRINDAENDSVLVHELTHFIQDLATSFGLANICRVVDYMKFVNNYVIKFPPGNFSIPVEPVSGDSDAVEMNEQLNSIYLGTGDDDVVSFHYHYKTFQNISLFDGVHPVPKIVIEYLTDCGNKKDFEFGGLCVMESMAYIIERTCYPYPLSSLSPDIPYRSAEMLVELIYPDFGKNPLNVLALCDASLQSFSPGTFFYDNLLEIEESQKQFNKPEEVYAFCVDKHPQFKYNDKIHTLKTLFPDIATDAKKQILGYFNHDYFNPIKSWLSNMFDQALRYRLQNPYFPLDIARGGIASANSALAAFIKSVGTPLVSNNNGETVLMDTTGGKAEVSQYSLIWAIDQINSVFWEGRNYCEMVPLCNQNKDVQVDTRCVNSPWQRSKDDKKCPFAQMWFHWGLKDYYPLS